MKFVFIFLVALFLGLVYSCNNDSGNLTCEVTGCKAKFHCDMESKICVKDCTVEECAKIESFCSHLTKECEPWCKYEGCDRGLICDEKNNKCVSSCLDVGCRENEHCNKESKICEENCNLDSDCDENNNEVCDIETKSCVVRAQNPCTDDSQCPTGAVCNKKTGYCKGGCADLKCNEDEICNPDVPECVKPCNLGECNEGFHCDVESRFCKGNTTEYPNGPYGKNIGDIIENLSWDTVDGGKISLNNYYNIKKDTDFPRILILNEILLSDESDNASKVEAEALGNLYDGTLLEGKHRFEIFQGFIRRDGVIDAVDFIKNWKTTYNQKFPSVIDDFSLINEYNTTEGKSIPFKIIVNPENMEILDFIVGTNSELTILESKLRKYEKKVLCDKLDCESKGSYCIYKYSDGSARCN